VPAVFTAEVTNVLVTLERRRILSVQGAAAAADVLALALELHLPVACGDRPLKAVLPRAGVKLA